MTTADIEYGVPCGHPDRALQTQREPPETFGRRLDGVQLTTGDAGVFEIRVDGELVWDKAEEGSGFGDIVEAVGDRILASA